MHASIKEQDGKFAKALTFLVWVKRRFFGETG
jgi:hypothetical protein